MLVLVRGEIWRTSKQISRSRVENQEIQRTSRVKSANRSWASCWKTSTFMHHCSNKIFLHCILFCEKAPGTRLDPVQQGCLSLCLAQGWIFLKALQSSVIDILDWWLIATKLSSLLLLQLPVSCHKITVQTLTDHPVGPSPCSNVVELPGNEFVPFVLFCYFDVHKQGERWVSEITSFPFKQRISQSLHRWR